MSKNLVCAICALDLKMNDKLSKDTNVPEAYTIFNGHAMCFLHFLGPIKGGK